MPKKFNESNRIPCKAGKAWILRKLHKPDNDRDEIFWTAAWFEWQARKVSRRKDIRKAKRDRIKLEPKV